MMTEKKIGGNQENTNLVDIVHVIDIIIGVVGVIEIVIGTVTVTVATVMILAVRILTIDKGVDEIRTKGEIEIESIAIDTMIKRGKEIEENAIVGAGAEVHLTKKKTADMNAMTEMTATTTKIVICEHTH